MKNSILKYYTVALYLCSTFVMLAQPGDDSTDGNLEGTDTPPMPIDDYIWILALVGLFFVLMKFRAIQKRKINS